MYSNLRLRQVELLQLLCDQLADMAPDKRLLPGVASSSASTPSLRLREGSATPVGTSLDAGGNVRVVVRVRGFLPRGMLSSSVDVIFG